jgi:hypothetical protein
MQTFTAYFTNDIVLPEHTLNASAEKLASLDNPEGTILIPLTATLFYKLWQETNNFNPSAEN